MSTKKVFWDTSQLTKTELEVLEVAKKRTGASSIQKKDGSYTTRHQKVIDNWQEEEKLTQELELCPNVVCYDFSRLPGLILAEYKPSSVIIEQVFSLFQQSSSFKEQLASNPTAPSLDLLLQEGVLCKLMEGGFKLSMFSLLMMDNLLEEIRENELKRVNKKGVMQYAPECDFFLWLLQEMKIIEVALPYKWLSFYQIEEEIITGTWIVELDADSKELVARDATEEELNQAAATSPTQEEVEIVIEEQQEEKEERLEALVKELNPELTEVLKSILTEREFPEGLLPKQLDTAENRALLVEWANDTDGLLEEGLMSKEEEVEPPKVYEFKRYLGGSRPPVNKRLIVVADIGEYKSLALFETYFANDEFFIEPSHIFLDDKKVKVLYWLEIDWGQEELVSTRFSPIYDNYVQMDQDEMNREAYTVEKKGKKRKLSFCFYVGLSQEQMNHALQFYKDATQQ